MHGTTTMNSMKMMRLMESIKSIHIHTRNPISVSFVFNSFPFERRNNSFRIRLRLRAHMFLMNFQIFTNCSRYALVSVYVVHIVWNIFLFRRSTFLLLHLMLVRILLHSGLQKWYEWDSSFSLCLSLIFAFVLSSTSFDTGTKTTKKYMYSHKP